MLLAIKNEITKTLQIAGVPGEVVLTSPPNPNMGDLALACFELAKEWKKSPAAVAKEIVSKLGHEEVKKLWGGFIERIQAVGPYVNFFINAQAMAKELLAVRNESYGRLTVGQGKKVLVEFGCPNPLKVFHLGHLKNLITGESVARILENAGYEVVRVNYQGDVGMHVAKALWAAQSQKFEVKSLESKTLAERVEFLGQMYAAGAKAFAKDEQARGEIEALNKKVYAQDPEIREWYETTRQWSLDYFETIYQKLGVRFDRLYFESETAWRGVEIVRRNCQSGVFKESDGAIIYEGSRRGQHDRVFINSAGFATYEAKELALAERHFADYKPDRIIHVVGKEQAEYFKVLFKAIEEIWPEHAGREFHLPGGYLQLRGRNKMSSRTGQVIAGDELLLAVEKRVREIMSAQGAVPASGGKDGDKAGNDEIVRKVTDAVLTYAMLKVQVSQDVAFDLEASVSTNGDSGPYLQYIVARIKSILRKQSDSGGEDLSAISDQLFVNQFEKQLLLRLAELPEVAQTAAEELDPSQIAQYLFGLAQTFNTFYHECPVLQAEEKTRVFRLRLVQMVEQVMTKGLDLLGIEAVEEM